MTADEQKIRELRKIAEQFAQISVSVNNAFSRRH